MSSMRFTIVDGTGAISFAGPPHGLKAIAAVCSAGATDHRSLLDGLAGYDARLANHVLDGLAVFDEHVSQTNPASIAEWMSDPERPRLQPFRVVDDATRQASLEPRRLGVVIFNLKDRRIIQIQNSYAELQRSDRGRIRVDGQPTRQYYRYSLPDEWQILP